VLSDERYRLDQSPVWRWIVLQISPNLLQQLRLLTLLPFRGWRSEDWTASDDRVRGGKSKVCTCISHNVSVRLAGKCALSPTFTLLSALLTLNNVPVVSHNRTRPGSVSRSPWYRCSRRCWVCFTTYYWRRSSLEPRVLQWHWTHLRPGWDWWKNLHVHSEGWNTTTEPWQW